jgi:pimeloyl-ACP methyl ester carboxylesterase
MTIWQNIQQFSKDHGQKITVAGTIWQYYRLGTGSPVLWLTGGLRRAAAGASFFEKLADNHLVIAPDYPPVQTIAEFNAAFDAILQTEGVPVVTLAGQSYGGMLAQAYLAHRPEAVKRLILSSSGPADYGKAWLPVESACIALARLLPEKKLKNMLAGGLLKLVVISEDKRAEWSEAMNHIMQDELTRADVVSHFSVAADLIKKGSVKTSAHANWSGRIVVLSAENDPTQNKNDFPRYEKLFGRPVEVINMGSMGHAGVLSDPEEYIRLLEKAFE